MKSPKNEIETLNNKLSAKENKIENLTKKIEDQKKLIKIFYPLLIVILSVVFYNKLSNANKELELKVQAIDQLKKESYIKTIFFGARQEEAKVIFSTDQDKAEIIISVAKETLLEEISSCRQTNPEFDVYRTCFRDLSIYLHNKLERLLGPQWIVTTGRVANCFMVTIPEPEHEEYFFRIGEIYFEVFRYKDGVTTQQQIEEANNDIENAQITGKEELNQPKKASEQIESATKVEKENIDERADVKEVVKEKN